MALAEALAEALSPSLSVLSASASFLLSLVSLSLASPLSDSVELSEPVELEESEPSLL